MTFVYLGKELPSYARNSLAMSRRFSGLAIRLIGNQQLEKGALATGAQFIAIEEFYDNEPFLKASSNLEKVENSRTSLWHRALERFFVLEQFFELSSEPVLLHAELDQLIFRADLFIEAMKSAKHSGLFLPFHKNQSALGSVVYTNRQDQLSLIVEDALVGEPFPHEMALLSRVASRPDARFLGLPTLASEMGKFPLPKTKLLPVEYSRGLFDPAQLGQWVGGIDPRNVPIINRPSTKFVDRLDPALLSREELESIRLDFDAESGELHVRSAVLGSLRQYNLHLHSKIHASLNRWDPNLDKLLALSNGPHAGNFRSARATQIKSYLDREIPTAMRRAIRRVKSAAIRLPSPATNRPSSKPFISGDSFRKCADFIWEDGNKAIRARNLKEGSVIFCQADLYEELATDVLAKTERRLTILLGNSDRNFQATDFSSSSKQDNITIFAQNLTEPGDRINPLPIGLENAWRRNHGVIQDFKILRESPITKINRIAWSFTVSNNPVLRQQAATQLESVACADKIPPMISKTHRRHLFKYKFVAAPPGNGLDTHRLWEAIYLRTVPIVLRSYLTEYYDQVGLPVFVVDKYADLESVEEADLAEIYSALETRFSSPAAWLPHWCSLIKTR